MMRATRPAVVVPAGPRPSKGAKCHLGSHGKGMGRP
jgi:hypothetical protein